MNTLRHDLVYGLRLLAKKPLFSLVIVLSLAVGVSACEVGSPASPVFDNGPSVQTSDAAGDDGGKLRLREPGGRASDRLLARQRSADDANAGGSDHDSRERGGDPKEQGSAMIPLRVHILLLDANLGSRCGALMPACRGERTILSDSPG